MAPNILVVLTDDHAQWAVGCYGSRELRTPTLDYLASTGVRMANAFTPSPVCSPARASFWTGRLPSQHGVHDYLAEGDPQVNAHRWMDREVTLAQILHETGYTTGLVGKWHLGQPERRPPGFDSWYSLAAPVSRPYAVDTPWPPSPPHHAGFNRQSTADHAIAFLRGRTPDRPFFLFVGPFATHSPWTGHAERLVSAYRDAQFGDIPQDTTYPFGRLASESLYATRSTPRETWAQYYASVTEIDEQVGRILDELDSQHLREETLVVYTADHGLNLGHHGVWGKGNGTSPYNMLEESIRVPLILNQPGTLLGGQVRGEMVTHCDLFTTLAEHAGVTPPPRPTPYPGQSFRDQLRGIGRPDWPDTVFGEYGTVRMVRTRWHKLVRRYPNGPDELFDLVTDPRETTDLSRYPEHEAVLRDLSRRIDAYFATYEEPERSGLRVRDLARHNSEEAWRDQGPHEIVVEPSWLTAMESSAATPVSGQ
ncbi:MAG: sulfatase-like hydrolase/transferase [Actinomycetes bacterium]